jgi:hypothetical protein
MGSGADVGGEISGSGPCKEIGTKEQTSLTEVTCKLWNVGTQGAILATA